MPPDDAAARSSQANLRRPCDLAPPPASGSGLWIVDVLTGRCPQLGLLPCCKQAAMHIQHV